MTSPLIICLTAAARGHGPRDVDRVVAVLDRDVVTGLAALLLLRGVLEQLLYRVGKLCDQLRISR